MGVVSIKQLKIKPENQVVAQGVVKKCRYVREKRIFGRSTHIYKVLIEVAGLPKPLKMKVKDKTGFNFNAVATTIRSISRMAGAQKPVNVGDIAVVVYDKTKPKKCYIPDNSGK